MYNHTGQHARKASKVTTKFVKEMIKKTKKSRKPRPEQLWSKKHYASKVKPAVLEALSAHENLNSGVRLKIINDLTKKAYEEESPDVRAAIAQEIEDLDQPAADPQEPKDPTPVEMQK